MTKNEREKLLKNDKMSFASFIAQNGSTRKTDAEKKVSEAHLGRALADTNYGRAAESFSATGLSGSGYEEYARTRTEAKKAEAYEVAKEESLAAMADNRRSYSDYVSNYEKLQGKISDSVIAKVAEDTSYDVNDAYRIAIGAGLNEENALATASRAVKAAQENAVSYVKRLALKYAFSPQMTVELAVRYGIKGRYLSELYRDVSRLSESDKALFSSMSADDVMKYLKELNS